MLLYHISNIGNWQQLQLFCHRNHPPPHIYCYYLNNDSYLWSWSWLRVILVAFLALQLFLLFLSLLLDTTASSTSHHAVVAIMMAQWLPQQIIATTSDSTKRWGRVWHMRQSSPQRLHLTCCHWEWWILLEGSPHPHSLHWEKNAGEGEAEHSHFHWLYWPLTTDHWDWWALSPHSQIIAIKTEDEAWVRTSKMVMLGGEPPFFAHIGGWASSKNQHQPHPGGSWSLVWCQVSVCTAAGWSWSSWLCVCQCQHMHIVCSMVPPHLCHWDQWRKWDWWEQPHYLLANRGVAWRKKSPHNSDHSHH